MGRRTPSARRSSSVERPPGSGRPPEGSAPGVDDARPVFPSFAGVGLRAINLLKVVMALGVVSVTLGVVGPADASEYAAALVFVAAWVAVAVRLGGLARWLYVRSRERGHRGPFMPAATSSLLVAGWLVPCP